MSLALQILQGEDVLMNKYIAGWKLQVEVALIYDAITMFTKAVYSQNITTPSEMNCYDNSRWKFGSTLLNGIKAVSNFTNYHDKFL